MELSATAKAILGIVAMRPRTGYEIKAFVDDSTRFFWAASYGQIYPELKRLSENGLVEGSDEPHGGRQRKVYRITAAGKKRLREWHRGPSADVEFRDEGMLKLFLAGAVDPARAPEIARDRAQRARDTAARLREIESRAEGKDLSAYTVLTSGIAFNDFLADHFERAALELERGRED
jgi:DNA-binding PadR family transcriptional regulator